MDEVHIPITSDVDVIAARREGRALATQLGVSGIDLTLIATAISEVARNILVHAGRGEIVLKSAQNGTRQGIVVIARDEGPGIPDIALAMQDGYTTGRGLGFGLPGAKRLMDEFDIVSDVGKGTTVTMTRWAQGQGQYASTLAGIDWGVAAITFPGEAVSGDLHLVTPIREGVLVAVIDGLGHGECAAAAAENARNELLTHAGDAIVSLVHRVHEAASTTRGVVLSLASLNTSNGAMTWLGVGNVEGIVIRADTAAIQSRERLLVRNGVVGQSLPTLRPSTISLNSGDTMMLVTDGIRSNFAEYLPRGSAQQIADGILAESSKGTDDALVLVARYLGSRR